MNPKQYATVGDLRKLIEDIPDDFIVYVRTNDEDNDEFFEVFLTNEDPKIQEGHRIWSEPRDENFVRLYGFVD